MQYNRVILVGRLTRDPEAKVTPSGVSVTTFSIAVDRPQSAESRQQGVQKETDFIDIVTWRQSAEYAANYLTKGRLVLIEGRLQIRSYETQDGQKRKAAEIVADTVRSMERREGGEGEEMGGGGGGGYAAPAQSRGGYSGGQPAAAPAGRGGYDRNTGGNAAPAPRGGRAPQPAQNDDFGGDYDDPFAGE